MSEILADMSLSQSRLFGRKKQAFVSAKRNIAKSKAPFDIAPKRALGKRTERLISRSYEPNLPDLRSRKPEYP